MILPALRFARGGEASAMRDASRGSTGGRTQTRIREMLAVAEFATACVLLSGIEPTDAGTFLSMTGLLVLMALVAGFLPARRASRTDPMVALREE